MIVAIIGSRGLTKINISKYIPESMTELISGGAKGIDTLAEAYADKHHIPKLILRPDYDRYGKRAPLLRDKAIVDSAELIVAIWDGSSRGTKYTIDYAKKKGKPLNLYIVEKE